jgi:transcriptional regulator with XRE-family HTH domain
MGQQPLRLRPALSAAHLFGARLRLLREQRGLSQNALGALLFCSGHLIGKIEKGERRPNSILVSNCEDVLSANGTLLALFARMTAEREGSNEPSAPVTGIGGLLPDLRRALDVHDLPDDGPVRPLPELRQAVAQLVGWRLNSNYLDLASKLLVVLPELHRAAHDPAHADVDELLMQAYRCADAIADKLGLHDLSARIIDLMRAAAVRSGDELTVAASSYVRAETFFASGDWATGRRMLEVAASRVGTTAGRGGLAAYGALHMRAAVLAARADDASAAERHINEAADVARRVPDGVYRGTAFGPASVRIHRLSLALDLRDIAGAIRAGVGWVPPAQIPAERRSHFFVDLARAHVDADSADQAVECLAVARSIAPQHVRHHPDVKAAVAGLLARAPRPDDALLELARWGGVLPVNRSAGAGRATPAEN